MKIFSLALGLTLAATTMTAHAATQEHDMSQHQAAAQTVALHSGVGVLKAVNAKDSKVQIAHEPIAELGWPAMTMWFTLHDPLPLELKGGDAVRFEMQQNDRKQWVIVKIGRK
jgi:Cu/Ag efflux protein CusF